MTSLLALGDSYTIGESVGPEQRWPVRLVIRLRSQGFTLEEPRVVARTGWTTDELAEGLQKANPEGPFDLVTLLIGVNDQYRGREAESYRRAFRDLLQTAVRLAGIRPRRVIVISIPDWGKTAFATDRNRSDIAREIDRFNAVNHDEARRAGTHYVDVTAISREAEHDPSLIAEDGLHPSGAMYDRWVDRLLPVAMRALREAGGQRNFEAHPRLR